MTSSRLRGIGALLLVVFGAAMSLSMPAAAEAADSPPAPVLAHYVSASAEITSVHQFHLSQSGPAQYVIATETAQPNSTLGNARDLVILNWDHFAQRWVVVWDGAKLMSPQSNDQGVSGGLAENAVLPNGADIFKLSYQPIASAKGLTDLAFGAIYNFGAHSSVEAGIVHFNVTTASLSYFDGGEGASAAPYVKGRSPHQVLVVPEEWQTISDPGCCPVRTFTNTVALRYFGPSHQRQSTYEVVSSTQSWLGVDVALPPGTIGEPQYEPQVVSVVKSGPAGGVLEPGDYLRNVAGITAPSSLLGAGVVDEVAKGLPGQTIALSIERNGTQMVVHITLGSTAEKAHNNATTPDPGYSGLQTTSVASTLSQYQWPATSGVGITNVDAGSPGDMAGLEPGDVITNYNTMSVSTGLDFDFLSEAAAPGTSVNLTYLDTSGSTQTTTLTMSSYPQDSADEPTVFSM